MDDCVTDSDCLFLDIADRFYFVESFVNTHLFGADREDPG